MKRKIICLAICVACLLTMLASCGSDTVCTAHTDADKNSTCDTCGIPVVTVVEKVPTEEEIVEMVVAAIPADATLGDVYNVTVDPQALVPELVANENFKNARSVSNSNRYIKYMYDTQTKGADTTEENWPTAEEWTGEETWTADGWKADDRYVRTYAVYDLLENKNVLTYEVTEEFKLGDTHVNSVDVTFYDFFFFEVTTTVWTSEEENNQVEWTSKTTVDYRFLDGTVFVDEAKVEKGENFHEPVFNSLSADESIVYYTVDDVMYAFDTETYAELAKGSVDTFVKRPEFDYKTDAYGISNVGNNVYVYDLTKWIECVYAYEIPEGADSWILNNGNILVQQSVVLPESAVNYDYTDGYKYDLVHTVVDVANKTTANLELGYYVYDVATAEEFEDGVKDTVKNHLTVNVINNKNLGKTIYLVCDDALAIIAEYDAVLPDFVSDVTLVADGVFRGVAVYGDGSRVTKLYNDKGEELATLPTYAVVTETYVLNDGKYYDFTMKLLLDPAAAEKVEDRYTVLFTGDDYLLLKKGEDVYYWNATLAAPVCVADKTNVEMVPSTDDPTVLVPTTPNPVVEQDVVDTNDDYFIVKTVTTTTTPAETEGAPDEVDVKTVYTLYNAANAKVMESEASIDIGSFDIEGEIVWVAVSDGVYNFAK